MIRRKTRRGRLARLDRFVLDRESARLAVGGGPVVDVGIGAVPWTTVELAQALAERFEAPPPVVGVDADPVVVHRARAFARPGLCFVHGGFDLPSSARPALLVRAMNVLRSYGPQDVAPAHQQLGDALVDGGLLVEGTCGAVGDVLCAWLVRKVGTALVREGLLFSTDFSRGFAPHLLRDWLPRDLRGAVKPGTAIARLFVDWTSAVDATGARTAHARFVDGAARLAALRDDIEPDPEGWDAGYLVWRPGRACTVEPSAAGSRSEVEVVLTAIIGCAAHAPPAPPVEVAAPVEIVAPAEPEPPTEPAPDLVDVAFPREFRGMWVATVVNLDFPSRTGLSADDAKTELAAIAEGARLRGLNALVFQVRPEMDALYASALEPWSRYLTGTQGGDPGFDPLATLVEEAHARGIEVHAWFNPYRGAATRGTATAANHATRWAGDAVVPWGKVVWLDPGAEEVRAHTLAVIDDVLARYDIDGVHLDDYFYPYPDAGRVFPDSASYGAYTAGGGTLERNAWRRQNVDTLVREIAEHVGEHRPDCRFGISPFGIYRPGQPEGISGMDQVTALNADPMLWYTSGWVQYLAPQLYWSTTKQAQRYDKLLDWWNAHVEPDRPLLVGLDATKVGSTAEWTLAEYRTEVTLSRQADRTAGQIWFRATPVLRNQAGIGDLLTELYANPALPPATRGWDDRPVAPPTVVVGDHGVTVADPDPASLRVYALYEQVGEDLQPKRILMPDTGLLVLPAGTWAISAVRRGAVESPGVRFTIGEHP